MTHAPPSPTDIIDHVNEDHAPELLLIARAFTAAPAPRAAQLLTLDAHGLQLEVTTDQDTRTFPLSFPDPARPAHENLRALVSDARAQLGARPGTRTVPWTLQAARHLSPHLRRLTFHTDPDTLSDWQPGYAARFALSGAPGTESRAYTVRRVDPQRGTADVDVFLHGATPGSAWGRRLTAGTRVDVTLGRHEPVPDFAAGPVLLLGDETALPTLSALLDHWADRAAPSVLIELGDPNDQRALDDVAVPPGTRLRWLTRTGAPGAVLAHAALSLPHPLAAVWGALDTPTARTLRRALRERHGLSPAQCRVSGYWQP
ncbi:SIP domain-containing protein (plasmid) [Deinococcus taeanensis]|uniref:SIP domain-containing protein n=1 Tax=Deinococcus taeanensis TaxID=2737050 RepID=UPI001CDBF584|nr:SIP domain-containing protein [Deinococcus taeanensis]UBV45051.1 SIP domain-containing protein [Deinococcus taeanensis]